MKLKLKFWVNRPSHRLNKLCSVCNLLKQYHSPYSVKLIQITINGKQDWQKFLKKFYSIYIKYYSDISIYFLQFHSQSLRKVGQDPIVLLMCMTVFLSYLPEAGQYSCMFLYLKQVSALNHLLYIIFFNSVLLKKAKIQPVYLFELIL